MIKYTTSNLFKLGNQHIKIAFLFLFLLSGFTGLIYESIWTHYLKLIFGHAAYAQSLVLSIFMGGLALGAYLISKLGSEIKKPLLAYALIEAVIGVFALFFHEIFIFSQDILFKHLAPNIDSNFIFTTLKWLLGILLILPQSILLGTTFPLISNGLIKLTPHTPGKNISLLYFNNSIGAAIGALVSGFVLIQLFGLPGTILTAGLINISIALIAILLIRYIPVTTDSKGTTSQEIIRGNFYYLMLGTAFFTGVASFFYEIAWIRMLTLVLGATTHAFELMISAFVLGLALGSFWIRKRIDKIKSPTTFLAYIQILMAAFALLTLVFYGNLFDLMEYVLKVIQRTSDSYSIFIFINHFMALIIMLPATFFAGMTLPLITNILLKKHDNKKVIGHVYASNTLGAIIGIIIAMNILLPLTGTKGLVSLGALIDLTVGISLLGYFYYKKQDKKLRLQFILASTFSLMFFQIIFHTSTFDPLKTSSGVFRTGIAKHAEGSKVLFHQDGKLSTVDVIESPTGYVLLSNNGKPDASINLYDVDGGVDELTMILASAVPIAINPKIKTVANIGMGSGQTVQSLLSYEFITHVDSIEIEKSVIDALPQFKVFSQLARYDKRSNIIVDDAKSFFSSSKNNYDLIISEPPNPWVSGVANLFTTEFYSQTKQKLTENGIFTQWLQLYEINIKSVASAIKALSKNFKNYALYNTDDNNILIIASNNYDISQLHEDFLSGGESKQLLSRIQITSVDSLRARFIGNKELLDPLFDSYQVNAASDYYPSLSYQAEKSLFINENAKALTSLHTSAIPINQILMDIYPNKTLNTSNEKYFFKSKRINIAKTIYQDFINEKKFNNRIYSKQLRNSLSLLSSQLFQCHPSQQHLINNTILVESALELVFSTTSYLGKNELNTLWNKILNAPCITYFSKSSVDWLKLHSEVATQNFKRALPLSQQMLKKYRLVKSGAVKKYLFTSAVISAFKSKNIKLAQEIFYNYSPLVFKDSSDVPLSLRLLQAHIYR